MLMSPTYSIHVNICKGNTHSSDSNSQCICNENREVFLPPPLQSHPCQTISDVAQTKLSMQKAERTLVAPVQKGACKLQLAVARVLKMLCAAPRRIPWDRDLSLGHFKFLPLRLYRNSTIKDNQEL